MAPPSTQELLKKINYIETDLEIQKQILHAIPSNQQEEMEKTIIIIAQKKKEIGELRQKIKETDPEEFNKIITFEEASQKFKKLAAEKQIQSLVAQEPGKDCILHLKNQKSLSCLIKAQAENGDCIIITPEGELLQFSADEVDEN